MKFNIIDMYFKLLGFRRFMAIGVFIFTIWIAMTIIAIVDGSKSMLELTIFVVTDVFVYIFLRLYQAYHIKRGATDSYSYLFTRHKKKAE